VPLACARAAARDPVLFLPALFAKELLSAMLLRGLVRKAAASARELLRRWWFGGVTGASPLLPLAALALTFAVGDSSSGDVAAAVLSDVGTAVPLAVAVGLFVAAAVAAMVENAAATAADAGDSSGAGGALCLVLLLLCAACCCCC
jgi:hypothetical protein